MQYTLTRALIILSLSSALFACETVKPTPEKIQKNTLIVKVDNAPWRAELTFRKKEILEKVFEYKNYEGKNYMQQKAKAALSKLN